MLADAFVAGRRYDEAAGALRAALKFTPSDGKVHLQLGRVLMRLDRHSEAVEALYAAQVLRPEDRDVSLALGTSLSRAARPHEAVQVLLEVLKRDPTSVEALVDCAMAHAQSGEHTAAIRRLREAMRLRPDLPEIHWNLGIVFHDLGETDAAAEMFEAALSLAPDAPDGRFQLGMAMGPAFPAPEDLDPDEPTPLPVAPMSEIVTLPPRLAPAPEPVVEEGAEDRVPDPAPEPASPVAPPENDEPDPAPMPLPRPPKGASPILRGRLEGFGLPAVAERLTAIGGGHLVCLSSSEGDAQVVLEASRLVRALLPGDGPIGPADRGALHSAGRSLVRWHSGVFECYPLDGPITPGGIPLESVGRALTWPTPVPPAEPTPVEMEADDSLGELRAFLDAEPTNPDVRLELASALRARGGTSLTVPVLLAGAYHDPTDERFTEALAVEMVQGAKTGYASPSHHWADLDGELETPGLLSLLLELSERGVVGTIRLFAPSGVASIDLAGGRVVGASASTTARTGALLVETGAIDSDALAESLAAQAELRPARLGQLLVARGACTTEELESALRARIKSAVAHATTWTEAAFVFSARAVPSGGSFEGLEGPVVTDAVRRELRLR